MIDLGPATEDDMVLAFLRAEVDSARFAALYQSCFDQLEKFGFDRQTLVDSPNLQSAGQNAIRKEILKAVRGYTAGQLLFTGFPVDVTWRRISMEHADLSKLKYANCPPWIELSKDTRFVVEGARNVGADTPAEDAAVNSDDVVAAEFFEGSDDWPRVSSISPTLSAARIRAHKEVSHLTRKRFAGTPPEKGWEILELMREIKAVLNQFARSASSKKMHAAIAEFAGAWK